MRVRIRRGRFGLYLSLLFLGGLACFGLYAYDVGFNRRWRGVIERELEPLGLRAEIARLTLDPVEGLTARDVRLYDLENPTQRLADVNRISLDVDVAKLVDRRDFLRSITLDRANLTMPVDPADPASEWLTVRDFNARLIIQGRRVEIARADGVVEGIRFTLRGDVQQPEPDKRPEPGSAAEREWKERQLELLRERRRVLNAVLQIVERFQLPPDIAPGAPRAEVELEVHGPLGDPAALTARGSLRAGPLLCGDFAASEAEADADFADGELTLRRLRLTDRVGRLEASASWKPGTGGPVTFAVDSSADLVALVRGIAPELPLPEAVVFRDSPHFQIAGTWQPGRPFAWPDLPVNVTGTAAAGDCTVRGERYTRLAADFAIRERGFAYLRNVKIEHESGRASGQVLLRDGGARVVGEIDLPFRIVQPFLRDPGLQKQLVLCEFPHQSQLVVSGRAERIAGDDPRRWTLGGRLLLRDFRLRGVPVTQLSVEKADVLTGESPRITAVSTVFRMKDGDLSVRRVVLLPKDGLCTVEGATSTVMPVEAVSMFAPKAAEAVARYPFTHAPRAECDGTFDMKGPDRQDFTVRLQSPQQLGVPIGSERWDFTAVNGWLRLRGRELTLDLAGRTVPGLRLLGMVRLPDPVPARIGGTFPLLPEDAAARRFTVRALAPDTTVLLNLSGRDFPLQNIDCTVRADGPKLTLQGGALLFSGRAAAALEFPDMTKPAHAGTVTLERVSYNRLRSLFTTPDNTGGHLASRFTYQMSGGGGESIEGSGTATLEEGNIFALPLLGPLSGIINALMPGENIAYSVAREAKATFRVARGRVSTTDFEAATRTFKLTLSGTADLLSSHVDFDARVNLRGAPGLLLYPVSKLFEYRADGTLSDPHWHVKHLPNPFRRNPREAADAEAAAP